MDEYNKHKTSLYYLYNTDQLKISFDVDEQKINVTTSTDNNTYNYDELQIQNVVYNNNHLYFSALNKNFNDSVSIFSVDISNGKRKLLVNLNNFLKEELTDCKECISNTLQGNFFSINNSKIGYFFYDAGYFITIDNKNIITKVPTVTNQKFKVFENRKIEIPGSKYSEAKICKSDNESFYQLDACSNDKNIFVLSNLGLKEIGNKRIIDVYDISLQYIFSFPIENIESAKPISVATFQNELFVVFDNNQIEKYKINE